MSRPGGNGNTGLYALLALGVLMVVAAAVLETMPDEAPLDDAPPPPPIAPYVPPPPPVVAPEPLPEEPVEPAAAAPSRTLLWHAELPGETPVGCVLGIAIDPNAHRPSGDVWARCADGRAFDGRALGGRVTGVGLTGGVAFQAGPITVRGVDGSGAATNLTVVTHDHSLALGGDPLFVEELSVPDPDVAPVSLAAVATPLVRLAVPVDVSGWLPVAIGVTRGTGRAPRPHDPVCEVTGGPPLSSGFNCRVLLRCRGELIYGRDGTGFNDCTLRDGEIVAANDTGTTAENSDPRFDLDLDRGRLVVSDVNEQGEPWSATFDLITDPRLRADVTFEGGYVAEDGARGTFSIRPFATPATATFDDETQTLTATAGRFGSGEYVVQGETTERLFFGRGARAIAGHLDGRTVWGFAAR